MLRRVGRLNRLVVIGLLVTLACLFGVGADAQTPVASPSASPSPTFTPTETPEPEVCELDGATTTEATIELIDVVEMTQLSTLSDSDGVRAKSGIRMMAAGKKASPVQVTLVRQCCTKGCTTGTLSMPGFTCKTLELPNRGNKKGVSCIPPGQYVCERRDWGKYAGTFEITQVPGRCDVLFHSGNNTSHTKGCVLLGLKINEQGNGICTSKDTVKRFLDKLSGVKSFVITIKEQFPTPTPSPVATYSFR